MERIRVKYILSTKQSRSMVDRIRVSQKISWQGWRHLQENGPANLGSASLSIKWRHCWDFVRTYFQIHLTSMLPLSIYISLLLYHAKICLMFELCAMINVTEIYFIRLRFYYTFMFMLLSYNKYHPGIYILKLSR